MKKKGTRILLWVVLLLLFSGLYLSREREADAAAALAMAEENVAMIGNTIVFTPAEAYYRGFIFYPGAQVAAEAYAPLMQRLAERDILCIIVRMPLNLAFFSPMRAEGIPERYPEVTDWVMGGHSLGGVMGAYCIAKHTDIFSGFALLGSYSTKDLSESGLRVLSVTGSEDGILNRGMYGKYLDKLPADRTELVIEGGCHAFFGNYGEQTRDGAPTISREEQQERTAEAIETLFD